MKNQEVKALTSTVPLLFGKKPHSYTSINVRRCNGWIPFRPT